MNKKEILQEIRKKMLSKDSTENVICDLPVKFVEWIREESSYDDGLVHPLENGLWHIHHILELPDLTSAELFDYWLEYIYKPE